MRALPSDLEPGDRPTGKNGETGENQVSFSACSDRVLRAAVFPCDVFIGSQAQRHSRSGCVSRLLSALISRL